MTNHPSKPAQQKIKRLSLKAAIVTGMFLLAGFGFAAIADEMVLEKENALDFKVFALLGHISGPGMTRFMELITFFGSHYFLLPAYSILTLVYLLRKDWRDSMNVAAIGICSTLTMFILKFFFQRQRPDDPLIGVVNGFSFPSGHSFSSFTFFGLLIYITIKGNLALPVKWLLSMLFFFIALLVAFSRVYLHVHYASDVVAGFFLAAVWLIASLAVLGWLDRKVENVGID